MLFTCGLSVVVYPCFGHDWACLVINRCLLFTAGLEMPASRFFSSYCWPRLFTIRLAWFKIGLECSLLVLKCRLAGSFDPLLGHELSCLVLNWSSMFTASLSMPRYIAPFSHFLENSVIVASSPNYFADCQHVPPLLTSFSFLR